MCGIFGSPNITPSLRAMLPYIGIAMQNRGRDAWGCSNGQTVLRYTGELTDSWDKAAKDIATWTQGIFHTRGASCGDRSKVENAHPFTYHKADGTPVIGIHNGIISNHGELDKKYGRSCEVDSMHIWMSRAEGRSWGDLEGWGNLAWFETREGVQRLNLTRFNSEALNVVQLEGGEWVFASEMLPIRTIAKMMGNPVKSFWKIDEGWPYWFAPSKDHPMDLWRGEHRLPFPEPWKNAYSGVGDYSGGYTGRGRQNISQRNPLRPPLTADTSCLKCTHVRLSSKEVALCVGCFNEWVGEFLNTKRDMAGVN